MHPQVSHIAAKLIDSQLPGSYFGENIVRNSKRNHFLFTPVCHKLGLETAKSFRNNAAYIQSWLSALKMTSG